MKTKLNLISTIVILLIVTTVPAPRALALPPFWKEFEAKYVKPDSTDEKVKAFTALAANEKTGKCNVCHVEGQKKTVRNTFGAELDKLVDKANFTKERLDKEPDKAKEEIVAALDKIVALRSVAGDDKSPTFGELIGQGKLPGAVLVVAVAAPAATPANPAPSTTPVAAANSPEVVAKIQALGGAVRQVAMNDDNVEVDFHLGGQKLNDEGLALVKTVNKVIELHLKDTQVTDAGLANIAGINTLVRLHLEQTKVTDAGLEHLKGLTNLTYLNLYNTTVTDAGLEQLKPLANLKHLYLFGTKVTDDGVAKLKQALPNVQVVKQVHRAMPKLIAKATEIVAAGNKPKVIREFIGRVNSQTPDLSVAHMLSPSGWQEPGQTPEFGEYTVVLRGLLRVEHAGGVLDVASGQAVITQPGEWVRYSSPLAEGAEYIAVCLPAFSPDTVHRDL